MRKAPIALVCLFLGTLGFGCASQESFEENWFERQAGAHRSADFALAAGSHDEALAVLQRALNDRAPVGVDIDVISSVRKDVLFRLADLHLTQGDGLAALSACQRGLSMSTTADVHTINLYIIQGRALQALGRDEEAAATYQVAMLVTQERLNEALSDH